MTLSNEPMHEILPAAWTSVGRIELVFNRWGHIVPEEKDWRECLTREYWSNIVGKLNSGDTVQIQTSDHRIWFEMFVLYLNAATNPPTLDIAFRAIEPPDLHLPAPGRQHAAPRYEVRMFAGSDRFTVVDLKTGEAQSENPMYKHDANELAAKLQSAADAAAAEAGRGTVLAVALREAQPRPKSSRPRGRPRNSPAPRPAEPVPMAAAAEC